MARQARPPESDDQDEGGGLQGFVDTVRRLLRVTKDEVKEQEQREREAGNSLTPRR